MTDDIVDPFAYGGFSENRIDPLLTLTPADRRFVERLLQLMPNYRFELSYYFKAKDKDDPAA